VLAELMLWLCQQRPQCWLHGHCGDS
jgi:hypothetical protein